jgi:hypothetical protein
MAVTLSAKAAAAKRAEAVGAIATNGNAAKSDAKKAYWCERPRRRGRELAT